jgi:hypothetical protein
MGYVTCTHEGDGGMVEGGNGPRQAPKATWRCTMQTTFDIAVALSAAVQRFWDIRKVYDDQGLAVPEAICDGWDMLMRIRDAAELELEEYVN